MAHYLDTSALVKLVVAEDETPALRAWLGDVDSAPVSSDLARAELICAVRRATPGRVVRAREVLDSLVLVTVSTSIWETAARMDPIALRTLDAIHLATALELGDDLESIVTYDHRLSDAAQANGIAAIAPE